MVKMVEYQYKYTIFSNTIIVLRQVELTQIDLKIEDLYCRNLLFRTCLGAQQ